MNSDSKILIVDDDEMIRNFVDDALSTKGFSTYTASNIQDAMRIAQREPVDLIITNGNALGLIGASQYITKLRKKIRDLARGEFPVLIQGPSGTGKEIVANAIHDCSSRKDYPIVTINCAAIPKHLEESEFFGHAKGAFTGAHRDKSGIITAADKSTLFLDEVGELSFGVQAKLLRVLENGEFLRIGKTKPRIVDIRLITATNKNLKEMVEQGSFREDLYFRLGIIITTKTLSEHKEDIPVIVKHFINKNCERDPRCPARITSEAMTCLVENHWQGNIRELKQIVNLLCHTGAGKKRISITDIQSALEQKVSDIHDDESYSLKKSKVLKEFETEYFTKLLQRYSGNISKAAKASDMHRPNLIKKLKGLGIDPEDFRINK